MHRDIYLPILADIRRYQSDSCSDIGLSSRHLGNTASLIHLAVSHQRLPWSKGRTMSPGIRMRARVVHADDERSERVSSASSVASRRIATPYGAEDLALGKVDSKTSKRKQLKFSARYAPQMLPSPSPPGALQGPPALAGMRQATAARDLSTFCMQIVT